MLRTLTHLISLLIFAAAAIAVPAPGMAAEPLRFEQAIPAVDFSARFEREQGWVGADGNYSVALKPDRILWLYSDTWIGEIADGRRKNCTMINNSVSLQSGRGEQAKVEFFWNTNAAG